MRSIIILFLYVFVFSDSLFALSAEEIARKSYNVNHSLYFKNIMIKKKRYKSIVTVSRMPGVKPRVTAVERFLLNTNNSDTIETKDLIVIRSGKLEGVGILMTSYKNPKRSHEYLMWLPALRKTRRMAEPKDAGLAAGDIAFLEDAKLRRFHEETYTLLSTEKMNLKLFMMPFKKGEFGRYTKFFPHKKDRLIQNRKIYQLKSTFKEKNHWYDYRISYIDSQSFSDYITYYYKNNKRIKEVYRHWVKLGEKDSDPKMTAWYYWYSKDINTGYEMMTYIPKSLIRVNQEVKSKFWSTQTLEKLKR